MTQRNSPRVLMQYHCFVIRVLVKRRTENGMKRENIFGFFLFWGFSFRSRIFHSYGDVTGEGLQMLTYARHSWPLSSEGYLACRNLLWHGASVIIVISEDPWQTHIAERLAVELSLPAFYDLGCGFDSDIKPFACGSNALTSCATAVVILAKTYIYTIFLAINTFSSCNIYIHNKKTG